MNHTTLSDHRRDPGVDSGRAHSAGRSWPDHNVQDTPRSVRTQAQERSPHPTLTKMSPQSHDPETPEPRQSTAIATRVSHDPENDHETGIRVAFAPRHPQITHARATQLRPVNWLTEEVI